MYRNIWLPAVGYYDIRSNAILDNNEIIQLSNHMNVKNVNYFIISGRCLKILRH